MSLFGGGRREPRERSPEDRRQALIERERRRTGNPSWEPPAGHPLSPDGQAPTPQSGDYVAPAGPDPTLQPARPAQVAQPPAQAAPPAPPAQA
ncbi:MAG: hypothetical protein Q7T55_22340, partial [Solirubrobacteraceae bacterium]|nr:hypothetical protein [Solirubrobacteraceae bacterium]